MLTRFERPLTHDEQLHLRTHLANARDESRRAVLKYAKARCHPTGQPIR